MTSSSLIRVLASSSITADVIQPDGTMWSHAAALGTFFQRESFTIDRAKVESFVSNFSTGRTPKVPMDYEHGTVNGAADHGQPVPKAGDVVEMKGVYSFLDFTGDLLPAVKRLAAKVARPLDDPRNFGLWIRWRPTARAFDLVRQREYTDLSICYLEQKQNTLTGKEQGPTVISIALTNTPAISDMLPIAAAHPAPINHSPPPRGTTTMSTTPTAQPRNADPAWDEKVAALTASLLKSEPHLMNLGKVDPRKAYKAALRGAANLANGKPHGLPPI
jgi:phage I-like protein